MISKGTNAILGVGPMSSEVVEAVFRFSNYHRKQLMLIASKNQIDYGGGYVNNWKTSEYIDFVKKMKNIYQNSDVKICRDHCGPGFNGNFNLNDVYQTMEDDIKNGFDLMHVDFCRFSGNKEERLVESKKAVEFCLKLNPGISLEIGTDENFGANYSLTSTKEINDEVDYFKSFCSPEFYVVQTGTIVKEIKQSGFLNYDFVKRVHELLKENGVKLKEHNADYLKKEDIEKRKGIVDAMNIAPQLGVVQTCVTLSKCLIYGVDFGDFMEEVFKGGKWKKWTENSTFNDKMLCCQVAGHYHFASDAYKRILEKLEQHEDIHESFINQTMDVINHYVQ